MIDQTSCYECGSVYLMSMDKCPQCGAINAAAPAPRESKDSRPLASESEDARCPNIVSTDEGTHHCALAEADARDAAQFAWFVKMCPPGDLAFEGCDPLDFMDEETSNIDGWRAAIDAAIEAAIAGKKEGK